MNKYVVVGLLLLLVGSLNLMLPGITHAQQDLGISTRVSRYEYTEMLENTQCRDCLVPDQNTIKQYSDVWLDSQKKDPQKAIDDIEYEQAFWENKDYYYCVAGSVDSGVMNGFPRTSSPYCPGKFCGSSFLTVAELIESLVRLVGPKVWSKYTIDRREVARRAKDAPSVTLLQRTHVAQALRRCPDGACPAENNNEFDLRLRWCSLDLARCNFLPYASFTKDIPQTPKLNILVQEGIIPKNMDLGDRFAVVTRDDVKSILQKVQEIFVCKNDLFLDYDTDAIHNREDGCPYAYDPAQRDLDKDGIGDVCDDDIDGDGILNERGVVDFAGVLVPRLALLSKDNCILRVNSEQENDDDDALGDSCDPDAALYTSNFIALQVDASPYQGSAPLQVNFTQQSKGLDGLLRWDFDDGTSQSALAPTHLFSQAGIYMVQATISENANQFVSILPIEVLPDIRLQAGLEALSKNLVIMPGDALLIQHVGVGDIAKLTIRSEGVLETLDFKESISLVIQNPGTHKIEMQAYNSVGQRVALSQFTVDSTKQLGSQMHASSLDPSVGDVIDLTTVFGGFTHDEVYSVKRDFGDKKIIEGGLAMNHSWETAGVYLVKQTIQFRDRTKADHENVLTILVRGPIAGKSIHLSVDELQKGVNTPFFFELETENLPVKEIDFCDRTFTPEDKKKVILPAQKDLSQSFAFEAPGSYPVFVLCKSTTNKWYHAALTVAVEQDDICLQNMDSLSCDMDKDGLPDLCDDDIDGDGIANMMQLLTKELPDCVINTGNIDKNKLLESTNACAGGASTIDNCPFVSNTDQEDPDGNGIGTACGGDGNGGNTAGNIGGSTDGGATAGSASAGSTTIGGGTTGNTAGGNTAGGNQGGATSAGNNDSDGDGIDNDSDACGSTPESGNGNSDSDGCPEAPADESDDPDIPDNPLVEVDSCTQCPCPEADYASSLRKGDRVRALLLDEAGTIIYKYTKPEIIQEDIPDKLLGK